MHPDFPGRRSRRVLLALATACGFGAPVWAQDPEQAPGDTVGYPIGEIVVTPTRTPTPLERTAATVTVVTGEEIADRQQRTIVEVLRDVPGLSVVQAGPAGAQTSVFSRGTNANHTLILIDGMEIGDPSTPDGGFDFAHLTADLIERVEVVRGPQASLYGSDAIGAVINLITQRGAGAPAPYVVLEGGTHGTFNQRAGVRGGTDLYDYNLALTRIDTDNVSATPDRLRPDGVGEENDAYENLTAQIRLGLKPADNLEFTLYGRRINTRLDIDTALEDPNAENRTIQTFGRAEGRLALFDGALDNRFGAAIAVHDRKSTDAPDGIGGAVVSDFRFDGRKIKLDWQGDITAIPRNALTLGIEYEQEEIENDGFFFSPGFLFTSRTDADDELVAGYAQDAFELFEGLHLSGSVRIDGHQTFGTQVTGRAGALYRLHETGTSLRASYGTGFNAPSLEQRFGRDQSAFSRFVGNPDLEPEESESWEIGIEQALWDDRLRLGAVYFRTDIDNLIQRVAVAPGFPSVTSTENVSRAETRGAEAFAALEATEWLSLRLDYTYTRAEDATTGRDLLRRPRHKGAFSATASPVPGLAVTLGGTYIGRRFDISRSGFETIETESYMVWDLAAGYDIDEHFRAFARIDNMFDRTFEDPDGFAHPGISAIVGVRARL